MTGNKFSISIIGLGLIGGSLAYALRGFNDGKIVGYDIDNTVMEKALTSGAVDEISTSVEEAVNGADLTIFCTSPNTIINNIKKSIPFLKKGSVITEICGVKQEIMAFISQALPDQVDYIGLHPMAGKEVSGFENADQAIFAKTGFIIILPETYRKSSVALIKDLSLYVGAGRVCVNSPEDHDRIIAYTSDLMHISATALCEVFPPNMTMAHTAGAFRDCTRIAHIDADLWTELFVKNADNIIPHLEVYINSLTNLKKALAENDQTFIHSFLSTANTNKKEMLTL